MLGCSSGFNVVLGGLSCTQLQDRLFCCACIVFQSSINTWRVLCVTGGHGDGCAGQGPLHLLLVAGQRAHAHRHALSEAILDLSHIHNHSAKCCAAGTVNGCHACLHVMAHAQGGRTHYFQSSTAGACGVAQKVAHACFAGLQREYDALGALTEVRSRTAVLGGWVGGKM